MNSTPNCAAQTPVPRNSLCGPMAALHLSDKPSRSTKKCVSFDLSLNTVCETHDPETYDRDRSNIVDDDIRYLNIFVDIFQNKFDADGADVAAGQEWAKVQEELDDLTCNDIKEVLKHIVEAIKNDDMETFVAEVAKYHKQRRGPPQCTCYDDDHSSDESDEEED